MSEDGSIRDARPADREEVTALLAGCGLPTAEVERWLSSYVVAVPEGRVVGVAGLEPHGRNGVLRSVAVAESRRGRGLGTRLVAAAVEKARGLGMERLYLLTTSAAGYFARRGFRRIDREEAPPEIRRSVEFREACPASAVAMRLDLGRRRP